MKRFRTYILALPPVDHEDAAPQVVAELAGGYELDLGRVNVIMRRDEAMADDRYRAALEAWEAGDDAEDLYPRGWEESL